MWNEYIILVWYTIQPILSARRSFHMMFINIDTIGQQVVFFLLSKYAMEQNISVVLNYYLFIYSTFVRARQTPTVTWLCRNPFLTRILREAGGVGDLQSLLTETCIRKAVCLHIVVGSSTPVNLLHGETHICYHATYVQQNTYTIFEYTGHCNKLRDRYRIAIICSKRTGN